MGRKSSRANAIPRLRVRRQRNGKVFYYYDLGGRPRHEKPLGSDYGLAIQRWAEQEQVSADPQTTKITFRYVAEQYRVAVIPTKAPATQKDNFRELQKLFEFFDDPPAFLDDILPLHVQQFMHWRSEKAKVRANREKALLSHIWNWARGKGYTNLANPCTGIRGNSEAGRDIYVEDEVFEAVWKFADNATRDAMDLAYLTGQRPSDVLKLTEAKIRDGVIQVKQGKTGAKVRITVVGQLAEVLARIARRKALMPVHSMRLVVDDNGQPISLQVLQDRFADARELAGIPPEAFQFRDLRAKAGTDKADASGDIRKAKDQLGHTTIAMTEGYVRNRRGVKVAPTR